MTGVTLEPAAHAECGSGRAITKANAVMNGALADSDSFYDGEYYYDAPLAPGKDHMAKIAKNTSRLNATQLAAKLQVSLTAIAAEPTTFTGVTTQLTAGQTKRTALLDAEALVNTLKAQLTQAREDRDQAIIDTDEYYENVLMHYVDGIAMGDAGIILLAGMDVAQPPGPPPTMSKVQTVTLTAGEADGSAFANWKTETGARWYELQTTANPNDPATWTDYDRTATVGFMFTGLTSGQKRWVRVRAGNSVNKGAWSDPACCMVP